MRLTYPVFKRYIKADSFCTKLHKIMTFFYLSVFVLLVIGPVALAWLKGEQLLDYLSRRQRQRQMKKRQRTTRTLPVREMAMKSLLAAEHRRNQIDDRIGEALSQYRQTLVNGRTLSAAPQTISALDEIEQVVLARESQFGEVLDLAGLQSDVIEVQIGEVDLLRQAFEDIGPPNLDVPTQAKAHLLANLDRAVQKRKQIDHQLNRVHPRTPSSGSTMGFDVTIS